VTFQNIAITFVTADRRLDVSVRGRSLTTGLADRDSFRPRGRGLVQQFSMVVAS
jgi:hypothetical protein